MGGERLTHEPNYPRSEIGSLIFFDRGKRLKICSSPKTNLLKASLKVSVKPWYKIKLKKSVVVHNFMIMITTCTITPWNCWPEKSYMPSLNPHGQTKISCGTTRKSGNNTCVIKFKVPEMFAYANSSFCHSKIIVILVLCFSEVDYVTPLCSQVTYEGLLDDMFGIHTGTYTDGEVRTWCSILLLLSMTKLSLVLVNTQEALVP